MSLKGDIAKELLGIYGTVAHQGKVSAHELLAADCICKIIVSSLPGMSVEEICLLPINKLSGLPSPPTVWKAYNEIIIALFEKV